MFDKIRPNERNWPGLRLVHFEVYMNGLPANIKRYLQQSSPRDLIQKYITS